MNILHWCFNSPIKTLADFYREVEAFCKELRLQGHDSLAEKIELAQLKGAVGSEIVGDIGLALAEVRRMLPKSFLPKAKELQHFARWHRVLLGLDRPAS